MDEQFASGCELHGHGLTLLDDGWPPRIPRHAAGTPAPSRAAPRPGRPARSRAPGATASDRRRCLRHLSLTNSSKFSPPSLPCHFVREQMQRRAWPPAPARSAGDDPFGQAGQRLEASQQLAPGQVLVADHIALAGLALLEAPAIASATCLTATMFVPPHVSNSGIGQLRYWISGAHSGMRPGIDPKM